MMVRLLPCGRCQRRWRSLALVDGELRAACLACGATHDRPLGTERLSLLRPSPASAPE